jgi:MFS family permease
MMRSRWTILAVLFLARFGMAFQFESIGALAPVLGGIHGFGLSEIGLLVGLYLGPGIIVAIPGGAIARWLGDRRVIGYSMVLMLAGGLLVAVADQLWLVSAGRVISGVGGVVINIVMTKMVVDWFTGREISTAMAIFINSWPVGIAAALVILPLAESAGGLWLSWATTLAVIALGMAAFLALYRPAEDAPAPSGGLRIVRFPFAPLLVSALIWALYNVALATIYSFGPAFLTERGFGLSAAGSMTGVFMIALALSIPAGGIASDRTGRPGLVITAGMLSFCLLVLMVFAAPIWVGPYLLTLALFCFGFAGGPVVALPSRFLAPQSRAFGMGVYYAIYYAVMMFGPYFAGVVSDWAGNAGAALAFGIGASAAGLLGLSVFFAVERRATAA